MKEGHMEIYCQKLQFTFFSVLHILESWIKQLREYRLVEAGSDLLYALYRRFFICAATAGQYF